MKKQTGQLVPAILLVSGLVGCGSQFPDLPKGTVTVNVTGTSAGMLPGYAEGVVLATFSSGQSVPKDQSTVVAQVRGLAGGTLNAFSISDPSAVATVARLATGNYGIIPIISTSDTCQVTTLTNATADKSKSYSGSDTNNFPFTFTSTANNLPIIPITLTGGDAIINITCNKLPVTAPTPQLPVTAPTPLLTDGGFGSPTASFSAFASPWTDSNGTGNRGLFNQAGYGYPSVSNNIAYFWKNPSSGDSLNNAIYQDTAVTFAQGDQLTLSVDLGKREPTRNPLASGTSINLSSVAQNGNVIADLCTLPISASDLTQATGAFKTFTLNCTVTSAGNGQYIRVKLAVGPDSAGSAYADFDNVVLTRTAAN